ncbi:hypothetical protein K470DRAFT_276198 [Piedraia hortae CBS 480.64]|uniref:Sfi1 spindle body domain-containing protein n=1 Tax=Piedraia hortae CBS 480.64 TaxID=1314780 RepID=A0A6A7C3L9_9PEZI|nr:hypothetical protein K470DRAFT_276198 [Piedraia hortae CBS 480.64]
MSASAEFSLTDQEIEVLHAIAFRADRSGKPPFKALFSVYDSYISEEGITGHGDVVFRTLLHVGEVARRNPRAGLVECLKSILAAQGITLVEEEESTIEGEVVENFPARLATGAARERRVSFDDARLEETWLSQQSGEWTQGRDGPRRRRLSDMGRGGIGRVTEVPLRLTSAEIERKVAAFRTICNVRAMRRCFLIWWEEVSQLRRHRRELWLIAEARDRKTLLRQSLDQWRVNFQARKDAERESLYWQKEEQRAEQLYLHKIARRAISSWVESTISQQNAVRYAKERVLRIRYFNRWRAIAAENAVKARRILCRKYLATWRVRLAKSELREEQGEAKYEDDLSRRCLWNWYWATRSKSIEARPDDNLKRWAFNTWLQRWRDRRAGERLAENVYLKHVGQVVLHKARSQLEAHRQDVQTALAYHRHRLLGRCLFSLQTQARLAPLLHTMTLQVRLNLQRKAFQIWWIQVSTSRQAAAMNNHRLLSTAWTALYDNYRIKTLARRTDDQALMRHLYWWWLRTHQQAFCRKLNVKLMSNIMTAWRHRTKEVRNGTMAAEARFAERQRRRLLSLTMRKMHCALREREDAERLAVEFANSHSLVPFCFHALSAQLLHVELLNNMAKDARFFTLTTRSLITWRARTTAHQYNRRRESYRIIRTRIKTRLVRECLLHWRDKTAGVHEMYDAADEIAQQRHRGSCANAFLAWRNAADRRLEHEQQAAAIDHERLVIAAFQALSQQASHLRVMEEQAAAFHHEIDLALLSTMLKKLQWAHFTATRLADSADALRIRNRDAHVRLMLRNWATQAMSRRQETQEGDPDSPSVRSAARRRPSRPSSPQGTPAYMRTPSRSRRTGRFKPIPTPAAMTPFNFGYLTTTPAPLPLQTEAESTLTPQVTPFARKLRAGGINPSVQRGGFTTPGPSAFRVSILGRSAKSVRFAARDSSRKGNTPN